MGGEGRERGEGGEGEVRERGIARRCNIAIFVGCIFYGLGWVIKGEDPLVSKREGQSDVGGGRGTDGKKGGRKREGNG